MYYHFDLSLVVNRACNLQCDYCEVRDKTFHSMPVEVGKRAIDRALASVEHHGQLCLRFLAGEPLLEARRIAELIEHAECHAERIGIAVRPELTTNGTVASPEAWTLMLHPRLCLSVSCDGLPEPHDAHRKRRNGLGSWETVFGTLCGLIEAKREFDAIMAVRPDTVEHLPAGVRYLRGMGVRHFRPILDLRATWSEDNIARLEHVIGDLSHIWNEGLPHNSISWFDDKAARLLGLPCRGTHRTGPAASGIAVSPEGWLYPGEGMIAGSPEDDVRLPGCVDDGVSVLNVPPAPVRAAGACRRCVMREICDTSCRRNSVPCSRGADSPDALLCRVNKACVRAILDLSSRECGPVVSSVAG